MQVTVLTEADVPQYRALMLHAYENAADAFTSTAAERAQEPERWWIKRVADTAGLSIAFGVFDGTSLEGTVALEFNAKPKTRHKALVIGMYVMPSSRGKGAARLLLQAALAHCVARQTLQVVHLTVTDGNASAVALYESMGFKQFGLEPMAILTPEGFRAKRHMWLQLAGHQNAV
jgi:ribosomal protein S18 acetylase RimI-like enzyme